MAPPPIHTGRRPAHGPRITRKETGGNTPGLPARSSLVLGVVGQSSSTRLPAPTDIDIPAFLKATGNNVVAAVADRSAGAGDNEPRAGERDVKLDGTRRSKNAAGCR